MRILSAIKADILFQFRHGFYYAYLFVTGFYVLALLSLKGNLKETITTLLLF